VLGAPTRDRIAERRESTRREILDAAWTAAREKGLGQFTLRDVATLVGMRPPSLYSHFESKAAIYDAMFGDAWTQYLRHFEGRRGDLPEAPRAKLRMIATEFVEFSVADPTRYQLANQRPVPGFEPSPESYAPSVAVMEQFRELMAEMGVDAEDDLDLWVALVGGLVDAQLANDPGGRRYRRLIDRAVQMYADNVGLPEE